MQLGLLRALKQGDVDCRARGLGVHQTWCIRARLLLAGKELFHSLLRVAGTGPVVHAQSHPIRVGSLEKNKNKIMLEINLFADLRQTQCELQSLNVSRFRLRGLLTDYTLFQRNLANNENCQ